MKNSYSSLTSAGMDAVRRLAEENDVEIEEESDGRIRLSGDSRRALERTAQKLEYRYNILSDYERARRFRG